MSPRARNRIRPILALSQAIASSMLLGCSGDAPFTAPRRDLPEIEIRPDAGEYGQLSPFSFVDAKVFGSTAKLEVTYSGGCGTHAFALIGSNQFLLSYPAQLPMYLRHDDGEGHPCDAWIRDVLWFDVMPAIRLHRSTYGNNGPFYLRWILPDRSTTRLLIER